MKSYYLVPLCWLLSACTTTPQPPQTVDAAPCSEVWCADQGDGTYRNPILHADYSDPDAIRVGEEYWLTASSFQCVPGLPILRSTDLVNWELVNYALPRLTPASHYASPQHGCGVWAPCIRHHEGEFYIYWGDPDFGIYMVHTDNPLGRWSEPILVKAGKGLIDPSPLWDDDGRLYLAHAWAASRVGLNSIITLVELDPSGERVISDERIIFDGNFDGNYTIEGAKLYKRAGKYYLFAPAGGVPTGWQLVAKADAIEGPYESRIVLAQGESQINGPHQGAWVDTPEGEDWFLHFQEKQPYGRVMHLNPMRWDAEGWCVMGVDADGDGCGEPVVQGQMPRKAHPSPRMTPAESDEFEGDKGLQWQWHANPQDWFGMATQQGFYRLYASREPFENLWSVPNLLLQKFPAECFTATTKLRFSTKFEGDEGGLVVMGFDYARLGLRHEGGVARLEYTTCADAHRGSKEQRTLLCSLPLTPFENGALPLLSAEIYLRVEVASGGVCCFAYSLDGEYFQRVDAPLFQAREGRWIGAKLGLYCCNSGSMKNRGWIDVDWFRITNS